jgi:hypothetical protein
MMARPIIAPSAAKRLTWVEPKGYRAAEMRGTWKSVARMVAAAAAVAAIAVCVAVWADLGVAAARGTLIAAGAIAIALIAMWALSHATRITVKVTGKAIVWHLGDVSTAYRFAAIDHCEVEEPSAPGRVPELLVVLKNGDREVFGVAPTVSLDLLRATLEERGVRTLDGSSNGP